MTFMALHESANGNSRAQGFLWDYMIADARKQGVLSRCSPLSFTITETRFTQSTISITDDSGVHRSPGRTNERKFVRELRP